MLLKEFNRELKRKVIRLLVLYGIVISEEIPIIAWRKGLFEQPKKLKPFMLPLRDLIHLFPTFYKMHKDIKKMKKQKKESVNIFQTRKSFSNKGLPIGGLGSGSIGRGYRGEFNFWNIRAGLPHEKTVYADQFSLFVEYREKNQTMKHSIVLSTSKPIDAQLSSWNWSLEGYHTYHALFPIAWYAYRDIIPGVNLICKQFSPVIPHNYKETSYPVGIFEWVIENNRSDDITLSMMFTFQNGIGKEIDLGGHYNEVFQEQNITGIELHHLHRQIKQNSDGTGDDEYFVDPLNFVIATKKDKDNEITYLSRFDPFSDGSEVWNHFSKNGMLPNVDNTNTTNRGESIAAALANRTTIKANSTKKMVFVLSWDMPIVRFSSGRSYCRRYTLFFGKKGNAARKIAKEALNNYAHWYRDIRNWQEKMVIKENMPTWLKAGLLNELYFLVEGGSVWIIDENDTEKDSIGHFLYLESFDYLMFNTYDVHFYASFALAQLWPKIELSIQRDFAKAVVAEDKEEKMYYGNRKLGPRNAKGSVPHDLGSPLENPWIKVNSYNLWDISQWKDLNPKFVLQVYRDYYLTNDKKFMKDSWPAVKLALEYSSKFDKDNDGIIENSGFPDQTYDLWSVTGISAYTGGLWLAALTAAIKMAKELGYKEFVEKYKAKLEEGKEVYIKKLWNGKYFNYDSHHSDHSKSIMADQLAGLWYVLLCDLEPYVPLDYARTTALTIFENNVMKFNNGKNGAINGMLPNGKIDRSCMQSQEVWTGTTYALASLMFCLNLEKEAFITAKGVHDSTYYAYSYWFQTPEAWNEKGSYRALLYMRPLAIWSIWLAYKKKQITHKPQ